MNRLPAISLTGSTRFTHIFSRLLILGFFVVALVLLLAPWRQFVRGTGRVIAFDPLERRVNVEALVSGRVKHIHVVEGQVVKANDLIAEIQDNDPNLLENLQAKRIASKSRIEFARSRVQSLASQIAQEEMAKSEAMESAREKVAGAKIKMETAQLNFDRVSKLFEKGLQSRRDFEKAILERDGSSAEFRSAEANLRRTQNDFDSKISSTRASRDSAQSDFAKAERELTALDIEVKQNERQIVTAPRGGMVLDVATTDGSYLKPGDLICVIIPETESRFVEAWIDGNDVPLVKQRVVEDDEIVSYGSPVRLAFEGWPAIQAVGWPQLAVGTFGGEVIFIDATDDGQGRFRIVIGPSHDIVDRGDGEGEVEVGWPSGEKWLRQGAQAKAWVMLDEVPLWFELWRQINGFPAIGAGVDPAPTKAKK